MKSVVADGVADKPDSTVQTQRLLLWKSLWSRHPSQTTAPGPLFRSAPVRGYLRQPTPLIRRTFALTRVTGLPVISQHVCWVTHSGHDALISLCSAVRG